MELQCFRRASIRCVALHHKMQATANRSGLELSGAAFFYEVLSELNYVSRTYSLPEK
jgi:hypothetical protein